MSDEKLSAIDFRKDLVRYWRLSCASYVERIIAVMIMTDCDMDDLQPYWDGLRTAQDCLERNEEKLVMEQIALDFANYQGEGNLKMEVSL